MSMTCSEVARETDVPDLIPARMLNEFCYCPRLCYLEWVQGEWAHNLETLEGRFGHRRVDKPSAGDVPEPEESGDDGSDRKEDEGKEDVAEVETIHTRSLMLSAPEEGLVAKMDLVDISAGEAIPVDYKRGRVPEVDGGAWEPERVQLCAQGLILRENGYACEGGILYFIGSRRRVGVEGMAAKLYFAGLASLFRTDEAFNFESRNRRPPRDPVNALLSFVYALLVKELTVALYATGFDPMLGFYHRPRYGRPSLALDLAEEFRPLIGDSVVLMLINNGEVAAKDFIRRAGGIALTDAGRKAVMAGFERRMDRLVTHPIFGYRISYRRILEVQARLLSRVLLGEIEAYPSFCTR